MTEFEDVAEANRKWAAANMGPDGLLPDQRSPFRAEPADIDDHHPGEYHAGTARGDESAADDEPSTWDPIDLGPYLRGEIVLPQPTLGVSRSDGLRLIYPGREHSVIGETESGKSWVALACVVAELEANRDVLYIHYEESDASSTVERLRLLGVADALIIGHLTFIGPGRPVRTEWLDPLLDPPPTLVVHDGVNEAMSLHGAEIKDVDGASSFRRRLIVPCLRAGAATLSCDHLPMGSDPSRRDAYGSVHKGNAMDGARLVLENTKPFGRDMRGVSKVFVTKDRPGYLRNHGQPTTVPGKTFMGTLVVDDEDPFQPFSLMFYAPKDDADKRADNDPADELADIVYDVIAALPDHTVTSMDLLYAEMRKGKHQVRDKAVREAIADLEAHKRVIEKRGKHGAKGYQAVLTSAQDSTSAQESADT